MSVAISGTARNAHIIHHIPAQKISAIIITNEDRLSLSHIIFGSMIFPEINWGIKRHASKIKDIRTVSNCTKLYKNGRESAIIPQIAGIKSKRKTNSPNIKAYSKPNTIMMMTLVMAFKKARKNLERKNVLRSS